MVDYMGMSFMAKRNVMRKLAYKRVKLDAKKNIFLIIAIVLTMVLFSTLLCVWFGISESNQMGTMRTYNSQSAATVKFTDTNVLDEIKGDRRVKSVGTRTLITTEIEGIEFFDNLKSVEMSFMDDEYRITHFSNPTVGSMAENKNEIVCDTRTLNAMGIEPKIGVTVPLKYYIRGKEYSTDFILTGYWESYPTYNYGSILVSENFLQENRDIVKNTYMEDGEYSGSLSFDVTLYNNYKADKRIKDLFEDHNYSLDETDSNYVNVSINPAYISTDETDIWTILGVIAVIIFFIFTGYLIIYNIFQISVISDTKFYGKLAALGADHKSIRQLIRWQALILSLIGLPIGFLLGYIISRVLLPIILKNTYITETSSLNFKILIAFIIATILSEITVWISIRKPATIATSITPLSAMRYNNYFHVNSKKIRGTENGYKICRMAFENFKKNAKKNILVITSIGLSAVLLASTYMLINGLNEEKYLNSKMKTDFFMADKSFFDLDNPFESVENELSEEIVDALQTSGMIEDGGKIWANTPIGKAEFVYPHPEKAEKDEEGSYITNSNGYPYYLEDGKLECQIYGMDEQAMSLLNITDCQVELNQLSSHMSSGDYIIVDETEHTDISIGDSIELQVEGKTKEYMVIAKCLADSNEYCQYSTTGYMFYLNESEILNLPGATLMGYEFNVKEGCISQIEKVLDEIKETYNINYLSIEKYKESYNNLKIMYTSIGLLLSLVIALIGIMNYINVICTDIIERKKEFAILQSIGMTEGQLIKMMSVEAGYYILGILMFIFTIGAMVSVFVTKIIGNMMSFWEFHFMPEALLLNIPILMIIALLIPMIQIKKVVRASIVSRLK